MNREPADSRHVGEHFMEFAIDFFNLAKNSYHQQNQIRANSAAFQVLMQLNQPGRQRPPCRRWPCSWALPNSS